MESISKDKQIPPYLVFFVIHAMQIGVNILGVQRIIAKSAGYDSWLSVILATLFSYIILFLIFQILKKGNGDLTDINQFVFGKWLGKLISISFAAYFTATVISILRTYIEVLQIWLFPNISVFIFSFIFLVLALYIIYGGFRTIVGVAYFSVVLPFFMYLIFLYVIPYSDYTDLLPILNHSIIDILKGTTHLAMAFSGYEMILLFYPFLQDPKKSQKWAYFGLTYTGIIYLFIVIISFGYYSEEQLQHLIWPILSIWKIVRVSFLWRFEYYGIAMWSLVILPNICLLIWCSGRILKKTIHIPQRSAVVWVALVALAFTSLFQTRVQITKYLEILNNAGLLFRWIFIPLLLVLLLIAKKVKKNAK